jgi:RNA polymerase sigma-70 factor (ECF subfamily)
VSKRQDEFEQAALPHTRGLLRFARRLTGDPALAEDLVQEAFLLAWRNFAQFQAGTNSRAWLYRILVNAWYGWSRKTKVLVMPPPNAGTSAHEALEIGQALDQLAPEQRSVLMLVAVEGFTCKETGEILNIPIGTVMSRLSRARQALRGKVGDRETAASAGRGKEA